VNKKGIIAGIFFVFSFLSATSQRIKMKTLSDSLQYIFDTYNLYVSDLNTRRPKVVVLDLPKSFPGRRSDYFSETEARKLCKADDLSTLIAFEKILSNARYKQQKNIDAQNERNLYTTQSSYRYYFIDPTACPKEGTDSRMINGCPKNFEARIEKDLYGVKNSIEDLLFSKSYIKDAKRSVTYSTVPPLLELLLKKSLSISLDALSNEELKKVKHAKIYFHNPRQEQSILWVSSNVDSIFISPYVIRAAFYYALNSTSFGGAMLDKFNSNQSKYNGPKFGYDPLSELIRENLPEVKSMVGRFYPRFIESFTFAISHELAHTYNDDNGNLLSEIRCDCSAIAHLKAIYPKLNLGVYSTLLQEAMKKDMITVWGVDSVKDLQKRSDYINKFLTGTLICDTITEKTIAIFPGLLLPGLQTSANYNNTVFTTGARVPPKRQTNKK